MKKQMVIDVVRQVREILENSPVRDMCDLSKKDRIALFKSVQESNIPYEHDGDKHGSDAVIYLHDLCGIVGVWGFTARGVSSNYDVIAYDTMWFDIPGVGGMDNVAALDFLLSLLAVTPAFKNYTPHEQVIYTPDKMEVIQTIPPERGEDGKPIIIRVPQDYTELGEIGGIPVVQSTLGDVVDLPDQQENVYLIVAMMVAQACPGRTDLLVPDTNQGAVRNEGGQIIGTTRFMRV